MPKQRIYIEEIELENFESHEYTVFKNFSQGFNCIAGLSDVGKTSVIRAIKLCAYNCFDQKMVRVGAEFCRVKITTNIGSVEVKKGPGCNLWVIKRKDTVGEIKLDKVGKAEVKQACDVLGMKIITLGETEVPINIMDQLERHFFIDGIGDKKTTGSSRAEIIDEICGLNGAEELIRAISLDQYRLTREITEAENRMKELEGKIYSETDILRDQMLLAKVEKLEEEIGSCESNISFMNQLFSSYEEKTNEISSLFSKIDGIQIICRAEALLTELIENLSVYRKIEALWNTYSQSLQKIEELKKSVSDMPDIDETLLADVRDSTSKRIRVSSLFEKYTADNEKIQEISFKLSGMPDIESLTDWTIKDDILSSRKLGEAFRKYEDLLLKLADVNTRLLSVDVVEAAENHIRGLGLVSDRQKLSGYLDSYGMMCGKLKSLLGDLSKTEENLCNAENKLKEIYRDITICPVTKLPIGNTCSLVGK